MKLPTSYRDITNYYKVSSGEFINKKAGHKYENDGYIFNASDHLYEADKLYSMTGHRAKIYCLSLKGILPHNTKFRSVGDITHTCHAVMLVGNHYRCDCLAYWHACECSHVLAAMHLDGKYDIKKHLTQIVNARVVGRPSNYQPVGYAAHMSTKHIESFTRVNSDPSCYLGKRVASRYGAEGTTYIGKVISKFYYNWKL